MVWEYLLFCIGYFSQAFDLELYETPFRSYDAQLGRFWQVEPLADEFHSISMFQFGFNNPISANDPTGLRTIYTLKGPEERRGLAEFIYDRNSREQSYDQRTGQYMDRNGNVASWGSVYNSLAASGQLKKGKLIGSSGLRQSNDITTSEGSDMNAGGSSVLDYYIKATNESIQSNGMSSFSTLNNINEINNGGKFPYNGKEYETESELYLAILVDQAAEQFGIKDIIALAAAVDNLGFVKKPFQMKGASRGTSYASKYGSKLLPQKMPMRLPTHINKAGKVAFTRVLGRFIGSALGPIGWGILVYDVGMTFYNTQVIYNKITENE